MPIPRRKPEVSNYDFLCALLYIIENGCKWRALPNEYGNWHTIYVRFNRWCKNGVIDRIFEALQEENIIEIRTEIICIDSTSIKWNCKYHIVFAPKYRRKVFYEEKRLEVGGNTERIIQLERSAHNNSGSMSRPRAYVCGNTTENEYIKFYGISEWKEQYDDI